MYKYLLISIVSLAPFFTSGSSDSGNPYNFKLITYQTKDNASIEAALFEGKKDFVVVFAHGAVFNKESWYFMAKKLQSKGIASLCIDFRGYGNSTTGNTNNKAYDILGAITYVKKQGFKNIALVGGSMGGRAVLNALAMKKDKGIKKVVLLSPAGGVAITDKSIKKLFVVSQSEPLFPRVKKIFDESFEPKQLKVFKGSYHAQNMFKAPYSEELTTIILDFLTK